MIVLVGFSEEVSVKDMSKSQYFLVLQEGTDTIRIPVGKDAVAVLAGRVAGKGSMAPAAVPDVEHGPADEMFNNGTPPEEYGDSFGPPVPLTEDAEASEDEQEDEEVYVAPPQLRVVRPSTEEEVQSI